MKGFILEMNHALHVEDLAGGIMVRSFPETSITYVHSLYDMSRRRLHANEVVEYKATDISGCFFRCPKSEKQSSNCSSAKSFPSACLHINLSTEAVSQSTNDLSTPATYPSIYLVIYLCSSRIIHLDNHSSR